jgi:hypothetical protein
MAPALLEFWRRSLSDQVRRLEAAQPWSAAWTDRAWGERLKSKCDFAVGVFRPDARKGI